MKKIISIVLIIAMLLTGNTLVFAQNQEGIFVVKDNSSVRIVKEITDEGTSYVTYYKESGTIVLSDSLSKNNSELVITEEMGLEAFNKASNSLVMSFASRGVQSKENTWSNFEYTKYTDGTWQLRRPNNGILTWYYLNIRETSSNRGELLRYQDFVENLNAAETAYFIASAGAGASIALAIIASIGTAGGASPAAILTAAGATGAMLAAGLVMANCMESCYDQYMDIKRLYPGDTL